MWQGIYKVISLTSISEKVMKQKNWKYFPKI